MKGFIQEVRRNQVAPCIHIKEIIQDFSVLLE